MTTTRHSDLSLPPLVFSERLGQLSGVQHGFSTRIGGVSRGEYQSLNCSPGSGDDQADVAENRRRIVAALGAQTLITNRQIHGRQVRVIDADSDTGSNEEADGLVTSQPGICLGALGADCAPVLFADANAGVVGTAHGGWQGALAGVTDSVIDAMLALGARRQEICAAVGPAIQLASYEVGRAFREHFLEETPIAADDCFSLSPETGNVHFNLPGYLVKRLLAAGLVHVENLGLDTYSEEHRFFSYRRMCHRGESAYGRQLGAICISTGSA